jgi:hypothetical protein
MAGAFHMGRPVLCRFDSARGTALCCVLSEAKTGSYSGTKVNRKMTRIGLNKDNQILRVWVLLWDLDVLSLGCGQLLDNKVATANASWMCCCDGNCNYMYEVQVCAQIDVWEMLGHILPDAIFQSLDAFA